MLPEPQRPGKCSSHSPGEASRAALLFSAVHLFTTAGVRSLYYYAKFTKPKKSPPNLPLSPVRRPEDEKNAAIRPLLRKNRRPTRTKTRPSPFMVR